MHRIRSFNASYGTLTLSSARPIASKYNVDVEYIFSIDLSTKDVSNYNTIQTTDMMRENMHGMYIIFWRIVLELEPMTGNEVYHAIHYP